MGWAASCKTCGAPLVLWTPPVKEAEQDLLAEADVLCTEDELHETGFYLNQGRVTPDGYDWTTGGYMYRTSASKTAGGE